MEQPCSSLPRFDTLETCRCLEFPFSSHSPWPFRQSTADLPDAPGSTLKPDLVPNGPTVVIDTSMGRLTCKTFPQVAPIAVDNFISLAEGTKQWTDPTTHAKVRKRFYDGLTFHRVIPGFMIQGGDPNGDGSGDAGYYFKSEVDPALNFSVAGRLAMANSGPDTNGTQFFITEQPVDELNGKYTIFGQCDALSVDLVASIARVPRNPDDKPLTPVTILHVAVIREGQPMPPAPASATPTPASTMPAPASMAPPAPSPH
jgi:peptidyl-prolyl cis-trans isomerase A (cyclophilin A)